MRGAPLDQRVQRLSRRGLLLVAGGQRLDAGEIVRRAPAPFERLPVGRDRDPVELDRPIDRRAPERNEFPLPGRAEHEHVRGDRVAEKLLGEALRVEHESLVAERGLEPLDQRVRVHAPVRIAREVRGRRQIGGNHRARAGVELRQTFVARRDDEVAADHRVGFARGDARRMQGVGRPRHAHMRGDRPIFLAEAGEIEIGAEEAVEIGGDGERLAHRDDARAADARHEYVVGLADCGQRRLGNRRQVGAQWRRDVDLSEAPAVDGDETRAEAVDAGIILVAARLVDPPLAAELGLQRLDRHAIGDFSAIAAAFADFRVNEGADGGIRPFAALAQASSLGRAGLVVEDDRNALVFAKLALRLVHLVAVAKGHAGGHRPRRHSGPDRRPRAPFSSRPRRRIRPESGPASCRPRSAGRRSSRRSRCRESCR